MSNAEAPGGAVQRHGKESGDHGARVVLNARLSLDRSSVERRRDRVWIQCDELEGDAG